MPNLIRFNQNDVVNDTQKAATSTWSENTNNLTTANTSSTQADFTTSTSSGAFFIDVHNFPTSSTSASIQYSIAYAHVAGSGSLNFTNDTGAKGKSATGVTYAQYRNLVFGDELTNFAFNDFTPDDFYVININRARYKHNLKPGTLNLHISGTKVGTTGGNTIKLTDDSVTVTGSATITNIGRRFNIVSGTNGIQSGSALTQVRGSGSYGHFYPDAGLILINARAVSKSIQISPTVTDNATPNGHQTLFDGVKLGKFFIVDSEEKISSQFYFVRATNSQFNYTTNNDSSDLVAVAKISQPIVKDFTKEALIRVKLDY